MGQGEGAAEATGHFEIFAKGYERSLEAMQARLEAALAEAAELRATNATLAEAAGIFEKNAALAQNNQIKEAANKKRELMKDQFLFSTLGLLTPVVGAAFMKLPVTASPMGGELLKRFVVSLSTDQIDTMAACLNDPQRVAFLTMIHELRPKAEASGDNGATAKAGANGAANDGGSDPKR